jgi:hypothetical protein
MAQNNFLEGVRKGMQAYLQTHSLMLQQQQSQTNQQYTAAMTRQMQQPKEKPWGSTPETYAEKLRIEAENPKPTQKAWTPTTMEEKLDYDEKRAKRLAPYKTSGKGKEAKPSLFEKYGVTEGDAAALDKAIRENSKGTQTLGRDKEGDYSVVKAQGEPASPRIDPIKLGDPKMADAVNAFLDDEFPGLKIYAVPETNGKIKAFPPEVIKQVKYFFARGGITEKMMNDLRATLAAVQIVDIDNADLLQGDKGLANHIRRRIDAWKTKGEPLFQNTNAPKSIEEASAQVRQWVPMMKNAAR